MPTVQEADETKQQFHKIAGFPNVLGCVDGTFVKIIAPKNNENNYLNRKGFHSVNVQMICDAKFRFTNSVAKWPGSFHDRRILEKVTSALLLRMVPTKVFSLEILAIHDSVSISMSSYLMTPFVTTFSSSEENLTVYMPEQQC